MKRNNKIVIGIILGIILFFSYIIYGLYLMSIEDKYGDFKELYYEVNKSDNYFYIIDNNEVGFIEKLDGEIYLSKNDNLKHILNYPKIKIEVYKFEISQTYTKFTIVEANELKAKKSTKLIYKN